ncbi:PspC domain-containing protein [Acetobacterium sp.]|jgi:phage shock protein PspC (stress-responsive transcriptional regulator)|uniref:PspC domain-containing protein n=1 Tax=Acetobacterium sp. TaxID=1872094 RepID=UPI0027196989|nr:PspC domain-containing protein [Acetobacterium sp.]MDO9493322.1 PspC domain-containing protein [Acetobacterium sp.]
MKKQLVKSKKRAILAGVCAGLGEYCNISPWVFRGLFLLPFVLRFVPGILSIIVYILLAVVLPGNQRIADQDVVEVDYEIIDDNNEEEIIDFSDEKTGSKEKVE